MRMPFEKIFTEVDGRLVPKVHIEIGQVAIAAGCPISPDLVIAGIEVGTLKNQDLMVEAEGGLLMIHGIYPQNAPSHATQ